MGQVGADARGGISVYTPRQAHWVLIAGVLSALTVIEVTAVHLRLHGAAYSVAKWIVLVVHVYLLPGSWVMRSG